MSLPVSNQKGKLCNSTLLRYFYGVIQDVSYFYPFPIRIGTTFENVFVVFVGNSSKPSDQTKYDSRKPNSSLENQKTCRCFYTANTRY